MKLFILLLPLTLFTAENRVVRSPRVECIRTMDVVTNAALALDLPYKTVKKLIMKRVDNYDKIATVAFPLKGQNIDDIKRYLIEQVE